MTRSVQHEIERLRAEIRRHDRLYYVASHPEISDLEYDRLYKRLEDLEAAHPEFASESSPTRRVGGEPIEGFVTVEHRVPMLSIDNVYNEEQLAEFGMRAARLIGARPVEWLAEYKVDGVALALIYQDGELIRAVTRGDGRRGDDVTHNARTMGGVPLRLEAPFPRVLEVRGEAFISNSDFAHLRAEHERRGEEPLKNSRNATAGAIKLLDPRACAARKLRFFAHSVGLLEGAEYATHWQFLEAIGRMGLPMVPGTAVRPSFAAACEYTQDLMQNLHALDFEVDGIVLKVNDLALRDQMGATSKSPRWVVAFKWEKYEAVTQIEDISVQVGKTGTLTPVAHLAPVEIAGTTVSRASLHNRDEIQRLGAQIGDWVIVEKAGKIIPHVVRVEEHRRDGSQRHFHFPTRCPECQTTVEQDEGGVYIRCPNPACPAQVRESLRYFASRAAMDIEGLGTELIAKLTQPPPLVTSFGDLYRLPQHRDELARRLYKAGSKKVTGEEEQKLIDGLLASLEASKAQPLWRLLTALNIRHVGSRTAQILAEDFGTLDALAAATEEQLAGVDEVGPVIARSIFGWLHSDVGLAIVEDLRGLGLNLGSADEAQARAARRATGKLVGKSVVVTGKLVRFKREEIEQLIHDHGGKPAGSVSKKTSFVVAGEDAGSKLARAQELGIQILTEDQFVQLLEDA